MSEIKYEAVFGDQLLFNDVSDKAVIVIKNNNSKYVITENESSDCFHLSLCQPDTYIAMRRIIKTPVWTVADQKAGRLPEVGVLAVYHIAKGKTPTEITSRWREGDELEIMKDLDEGLYSVFNKRTETCSNLVIDCINPIETPSEKAQRLEDEFINYVLHHEKSQINSSEELVAAKRAIKLAYKLQLSGELKAPRVER